MKETRPNSRRQSGRCSWHRPSLCACALFAVVYAAPGMAQEDELLVVGSSEEIDEERRRSAPPVLVVTPEVLELSVQGEAVAPAHLVVSNGGGRALSWNASSATDALRVSPSEGRLGFGEKQEVEVRVNPAGLPPGVTRGSIMVEAPGAGSSPVTVALTIRLPEPKETAEGGEEGSEAASREAGALQKVLDAEEERAPADDARHVSAAPAGAEGRGAFGVRVGLLVPGDGDTQAYDPSLLVGLVYSLAPRDGSQVACEFGAEFSRAEGRDSDVFSDVTIARADVLYGSRRTYLLSGLEGYLVGFEGDVLFSGGLGLGGGIAFAGGRIDVRVRHSLLLGSTNLKGVTLLALGAVF